MKVKKSFRRFVSFLLLLLELIIITSLCAETASVNAIEETYGWFEVGTLSARYGGISDNEYDSNRPSLDIGPDGTPVVAWDDDRHVYVRRWDGTSWVEMGSGSASGDGIGGGGGPGLSIGPDGIPVVAYVNIWSGDDEIYVRRWDGTSWVEMGSGSASGGGISDNDMPSTDPSLAVGPDGQPIVAWTDNDGSIFVRRWDGTSWVEMGSGSASGDGISNTPGPMVGPAGAPSLAIGPDGTAMVAWQNEFWGQNPEIHLRRWDGASWVEMGSGSATGGGISDNGSISRGPSLAIDLSGKPVVAWQDEIASDRPSQIYVRRWNGTSWVEMGSGSASGGGISNTSGNSYGPSLEISPAGVPIIAWQGSSGGNHEIYVRRWDGTSWVEMGSGSASGGGISDNEEASRNPSLAISPDGNPMIAWDDDSIFDDEIYVRGWRAFVPPTAGFEGTPTEGTFPLRVVFTNLSGGDFETCLWEFENSWSIDTCDDPYKNFTKKGSYNVSLTVTWPDTDYSNTLTRTDYITVFEPVAADFNASPTSGAAPLAVDLTNLSTGDFDQCLWDFGDNNTSDVCDDPSHTYSESGTYSVSLAVDGPGGSNTVTKTDYITVYESVAVDFSASPTSGLPALVVDFTNLSTGDFDQCLWDFGDNSTSDFCNDPSHTYDESGAYTVSLTVTGAGGNDTMTKTDFITTYEPVKADFSVSPERGAAPINVQFSNLSSGDFDQCLWDFGDGVTYGGCADFKRWYGQEGEFTVSLTVKGPGGEDTMIMERCVKVGLDRIFLPLTTSRYDGPYGYFDDFSDVDSGWSREDYENVSIGYRSGEYRILIKKEYWAMAVTPDLVLPADYRIEVEARQVSNAAGTYGLLFGFDWGKQSSEGYQLLVYPPAQIWHLSKKKMDGSWQVIMDWTYSSAIKQGTGKNHLQVDRVGTAIHLTINDDLVAELSDTSHTGPGRDAGVIVYSYEDAPVDVRFDNFGAYSAP